MGQTEREQERGVEKQHWSDKEVERSKEIDSPRKREREKWSQSDVKRERRERERERGRQCRGRSYERHGRRSDREKERLSDGRRATHSASQAALFRI